MIAIQRPGGSALYLLADGAAYELTADHLILPDGTMACDVTTATSEVAEGVAAPALFVGGAMRWTDGAWSIVDQPAYDAAAAAAASQAADLHAIAVSAQFTARLAAGLLYQGQVIDIDGDSRADLGGMALTAALVNMGQLTWPDDISKGWVARGNVRVPLPAPADGIALATTAAAYYSALVQHESDLLTEPSADPATGWP